MDDNERLRQRAHQIWEDEGRPEGRAAEHWARAQQELGSGSGLRGNMAPEGQRDTLRELPAEDVPADSSRADGRIIQAGEGGAAGGLDEAEEALASPENPDEGGGR